MEASLPGAGGHSAELRKAASARGRWPPSAAMSAATAGGVVGGMASMPLSVNCRSQLHRPNRLAANSASSSNTASPLPSPSAKTNPPCCPSSSTRSTARKLLIYSDHSSAHPTECRRTHQLHRQDARRRAHHRLRCRRLRRRSADGNRESRRQAPDQLCRRSGHAHHHPVRFQRRVVREIHVNRGMLTAKTAAVRDQNLHHPQCRSEGQDAGD